MSAPAMLEGRGEPAHLLAAVTRRLRLGRWFRHAAALGLSGVIAASLIVLLGKIGLRIPPAAPAGLVLTAVAWSFRASLARGAGLEEAAYLVDQRAAGAERFATWLELSGSRDSRASLCAALHRECASIAARTSIRDMAPWSIPRWALPVAAAAALLATAAAVAPAAGAEVRAACMVEGGRLGDVARALKGAPLPDAAALRDELVALARALEQGRIDPESLRRAIARARRAADEQRRLETVPDTLQEMARALPCLERLASAFELGAPAGEAPVAAAELARGEASTGQPTPEDRALERTRAAAALNQEPAFRRLGGAVGSGSARLAADEASALARELADAGAYRAAVSAALARLEAAARSLGVAEAPSSASSRAALPEGGPIPPRPELRGSDGLPPRLAAALERYFTEQERTR